MWHSAYKAYAYPNVEPGSKPAASTAVEAFAKTFEREVVGPRAPVPVADLEEASNPNPKGFEILPAADRCVNWPKELIEQLTSDSNACELPSMSQEVYIYTQDSEEGAVVEEDEVLPDWDERFSNDTEAVQKKKEEGGSVFAALIPLWKELLASAEKAPFTVPKTCEQLRTIIAGLNLVDGGEKRQALNSSMAIPLAKSRKRKAG